MTWIVVWAIVQSGGGLQPRLQETPEAAIDYARRMNQMAVIAVGHDEAEDVPSVFRQPLVARASRAVVALASTPYASESEFFKSRKLTRESIPCLLIVDGYGNVLGMQPADVEPNVLLAAIRNAMTLSRNVAREIEIVAGRVEGTEGRALLDLARPILSKHYRGYPGLDRILSAAVESGRARLAAAKSVDELEAIAAEYAGTPIEALAIVRQATLCASVEAEKRVRRVLDDLPWPENREAHRLAVELLKELRKGKGVDIPPEGKIGEIPARRPFDSRVNILAAPSMERCAFWLEHEQDRFVLEGGVDAGDGARWIGWKMPEGRSVVLSGRRLLVGGVEQGEIGEVSDAALVNRGMTLVAAVVKDGRTIVSAGERRAGPFESAQVYASERDELVYTYTQEGKRFLRIGDREFECRGLPIELFRSGERIAWVESLSNRSQRAVVDGRAGVECDVVQGGITFSPDGRHDAYITRQGDRYRGWIDGREIVSERSVVAARVFDDGTPVWMETWVETLPNGETRVNRGRIVIKGVPETRVLPRPITVLDFFGGRIIGASRTDEKSVRVEISADGKVRYDELEGRMGPILASPDGTKEIYSVQTAKGSFIHIDGERRGPFERSEFFFARRKHRWGYVAVQRGRVLFEFDGRSATLPLADFSAVRLSQDETTLGVVGIRSDRPRDVWVLSAWIE